MAEPKTSFQIEQGPAKATSLTAADVVGLILTVLWIGSAAVFFLVLAPTPDTPFDPLRFAVALTAVFLPVAFIWVGVSAGKASRAAREESERLRAAVDAMRASYTALASEQAGSGKRAPIEAKLDALVEAQKRLDASISELARQNAALAIAPRNPHPERPALTGPDTATPETTDQPALALGAPNTPAPPPIDTADFLRALNFPEDENDAEGFRSLRIALKDRSSAGLIRSAQDVLTLLSEDGIYMDDLAPDRARPEVWRKFAQGERGPSISALGGVRDRSSLALSAGRMRQDPIFRDAVHHFLRKFDQTFVAFERSASDAEIIGLAETRTARAFMLLGRVSGTFD